LKAFVEAEYEKELQNEEKSRKDSKFK